MMSDLEQLANLTGVPLDRKSKAIQSGTPVGPVASETQATGKSEVAFADVESLELEARPQRRATGEHKVAPAFPCERICEAECRGRGRESHY